MIAGELRRADVASDTQAEVSGLWHGECARNQGGDERFASEDDVWRRGAEPGMNPHGRASPRSLITAAQPGWRSPSDRFLRALRRVDRAGRGDTQQVSPGALAGVKLCEPR